MGSNLSSSKSISARRDDNDSDNDEVFESDDPFESVYELRKKLGEGSYAHVYTCVHRKTKRRDAVKIVPFSRLRDQDDLQQLEEEINILKGLKHKNIVRLRHIFRSSKAIYIVQELAAGGELFDRIVAKRNYNEEDARLLMQQVLRAISYAHAEGVTHRDLKPENILLADPDDDVTIKLADFGMAHKLDTLDEGLSTICGSPGYMAPEILLEQPYNEKVDVWSAGTILFCILGGYNPFEHKNMRIMMTKIKSAAYDFKAAAFQLVSEDAKELIRHMLVKDPQKRLTARACLEHKWFKVEGATLKRHELGMAKENLRQLRARRRFKAAAGAVISMNRLKLLTSGESLSGVRIGPSFSTPGSGSTTSSIGEGHTDLERSSSQGSSSEYSPVLPPQQHYLYHSSSNESTRSSSTSLLRPASKKGSLKISYVQEEEEQMESPNAREELKSEISIGL